jgi:hypothetical protein
VEKQDTICRAIKKALEEKGIESFVWLKLCELGHSADN